MSIAPTSVYLIQFYTSCVKSDQLKTNQRFVTYFNPKRLSLLFNKMTQMVLGRFVFGYKMTQMGYDYIKNYLKQVNEILCY